MRITYPGHAALLVTSKNTNYMCDPWLVTNHINNCSVWLYPPRRLTIDDLPKLDFMYISHEHDDHSNIDTLKALPKNIPIYILKFRNNYDVLYQRLKKCGMTDIRECEPFKKYSVNDHTEITVFPSDEGWIDSSACITTDGFTVYHGNDNTMHPETLRKIAQTTPVDIAFLPYAGFSGFPASYEFSDEIKKKFAEKKKTEAVEIFFQSLEALNPKISVPAAGDLCLVGEDLAWINYFDRCSPDEVLERAKAKGLGNRVLSMRAGDAYLRDEGFVPHPKREEWTYSIEDQQRYARLPEVNRTLDEYNKWLHDIDNPKFQLDLIEYFQAGLKKFETYGREVGPYIFSIRTTGKLKASATVNFGDMTVREGFDENYTKKVEMPGTVLFRVMRQDFLWGDAYSSCRMVLNRRPPENYNRKFWQWLYALDGLGFYKSQSKG
jgi:L-ascorbate metabolism protein UlaG (beta-lactamase superfamily)